MSLVKPVEYIFDKKEGMSFQYVPILQSLSEILKDSDIQGKLLTPNYSHSCDYTSFHDGSHFKENRFLSGEEFRISLLLNCDDFEICNPLGTSRKKHKVTGVYWVLADIPALLRSHYHLFSCRFCVRQMTLSSLVILKCWIPY